LRFAPEVFLPLSSGVTNPMGRLIGSGGVINSRKASKTCLSWLRVLRLKARVEGQVLRKRSMNHTLEREAEL